MCECQWLDIATAPKDATKVLVYVPKRVVRTARTLREYFSYISIGYMHTPGNPELEPFWVTTEAKNLSRPPTHWMPLPDPPPPEN